jgi:hypothetical protein
LHDSLSKDIRDCYAHAASCARDAQTAGTGELRNDFLQLEKNWLKLARSYELALQLTAYTKETKRKRDQRREREPAHSPANAIKRVLSG